MFLICSKADIVDKKNLKPIEILSHVQEMISSTGAPSDKRGV